MNEKIRQHLKDYAVKNNWSTDDDSLIEIIRESNVIWRGDEDDHRHWTECTSVVNINGMFIAYADAMTTGDANPEDKGWEFDPDAIWEVTPKEKITTIYEAVKE